MDFPSSKDPVANLVVDESRKVLSIDIFYTQQGQMDGQKDNSINTKNRFWHHAKVVREENNLSAKLPIFSLKKPLWAYANVTYELDNPITGAGYYYGVYTAGKFTLSSLMSSYSPDSLEKSKVIATMKPTLLIEDFKDDWQKEWFSYHSKSGVLNSQSLSSYLGGTYKFQTLF